MWNSPWPAVMLVSALAYSSISDIGTWAWITCVAPFASPEPTRPRRLDRSPITSPTYWAGHRDVQVHHRLEQRRAPPARARP